MKENNVKIADTRDDDRREIGRAQVKHYRTSGWKSIKRN